MIKSSEKETEEDRDDDESEYLFKSKPKPPNYANLLQQTNPRNAQPTNGETNTNIYQLFSIIKRSKRQAFTISIVTIRLHAFDCEWSREICLLWLDLQLYSLFK